jgi:hypothetical protein
VQVLTGSPQLVSDLPAPQQVLPPTVQTFVDVQVQPVAVPDQPQVEMVSGPVTVVDLSGDVVPSSPEPAQPTSTQVVTATGEVTPSPAVTAAPGETPAATTPDTDAPASRVAQGGELPVTGGGAGLLAGSAALLAAGAGLVAAARREEDDDEPEADPLDRAV